MEFAGARENHNTDLSITQDRKLFSFLQQSTPPFRERHLPARRIVNSPNHDLTPPHIDP